MEISNDIQYLINDLMLLNLISYITLTGGPAYGSCKLKADRNYCKLLISTTASKKYIAIWRSN